jgi:hypothetical protein
MQGCFLVTLPDLARSAPVVSCVCVSLRAGLALLGLTLDGFMITVFETWVLWSAVMLVLRRRSA